MYSKTSLRIIFSIIIAIIPLIFQTRENRKDNTVSAQIESQNKSITNEYKVKRVVDGDTFEIESGEKVRLIGIDAPESVATNKLDGCLGEESAEFLRSLVEGKVVKLEPDKSNMDKYQRLLRYVWIDEKFVNNELVANGFAVSYAYKPDIKYQEIFNKTQDEARSKKIGIWGPECKNEGF